MSVVQIKTAPKNREVTFSGSAAIFPGTRSLSGSRVMERVPEKFQFARKRPTGLVNEMDCARMRSAISL